MLFPSHHIQENDTDSRQLQTFFIQYGADIPYPVDHPSQWFINRFSLPRGFSHPSIIIPAALGMRKRNRKRSLRISASLGKKPDSSKKKKNKSRRGFFCLRTEISSVRLLLPPSGHLSGRCSSLRPPHFFRPDSCCGSWPDKCSAYCKECALCGTSSCS